MLKGCLSVLVLTIAIGVALVWVSLPAIIHWVVNNQELDSPDVIRLRLGHAMAGGGVDGDVAIADSMKTMLLAKVLGPRPTQSRQAWQQLTRAMAEAESKYLVPANTFGFGPVEFAANEIAEGIRYAAHVSRLALELYLEESPRFVTLLSPTMKLLGDNPDALYFIANVRDTAVDYNISGCRSHELYFSLSVHGASDGNMPFQRVLTDINNNDIAFDDNDCFSVLLSRTQPTTLPPATTWLELPAEALTIISRAYYETTPSVQINTQVLHDRDYPHIALVSPSISPPQPDDTEMAKRLLLAADFIRDHTVDMPLPDPITAPPFFALSPNVMGVPMKWGRENAGMGAVDIAYASGRFLLKSDETLVIRGVMPGCVFANLVLWNRQMQTLNYVDESKPVTVHRGQMNLGANNVYTLVLSGENPFSTSESEKSNNANWVFTEGRPTATMFFRFVLPEGKVEQPTTHVVKMADVVAFLKR